MGELADASAALFTPRGLSSPFSGYDDCGPYPFERLGEGDILLIDSSHTFKINGDVYIEFLQILPRLAKGVVVHVHDIYIPGLCSSMAMARCM